MVDHEREGYTARFLVNSSRVRKILKRPNADKCLDKVYREAIDVSGTRIRRREDGTEEVMISVFGTRDWQHYYALELSHLIGATYSTRNIVRVDFSSCNPKTPWDDISQVFARRLSYGKVRNVKYELAPPMK